jgi:hypothetical protein
MQIPILTRVLIFFVLPLLAVLAYPPTMLAGGLPVVLIVALIFILISALLWRGSSRALTLTIFIQGMNIIVRIMMFFPQSIPRAGQYNFPYMILSILALALSLYLVFRLDRADIRSQLVT